MEEKKQKLIEKIKEERDSFINNHHHTTEHDLVIKYLETGKYKEENVEQYGLLDAVINDFKQVYSDYCS